MRQPAPPACDPGQSARAVLMINPARFAANPRTRPSNRFQGKPRGRPNLIASRARAEVQAVAGLLRAHGVHVVLVEGQSDPALPDEVFPNNWISCHADGTLVVYPMLAENRRPERRQDVVELLRDNASLAIRRLVDLSSHEFDDRFLEGTGSIVFDHVHRIAYACLSPRTHLAPLTEVCALLGYHPLTFHAVDSSGTPIYHTNVLMSVGTHFAVVCADAITDPIERETVVTSLAGNDREVLAISMQQMHEFAANILELRGDGPLIALSRRALEAWSHTGSERLARHGELLVADIPTIETAGGGSMRCMLAELFVPPKLKALWK